MDKDTKETLLTLGGLALGAWLLGKIAKGENEYYKCPRCNYPVNGSMFQCPNCGQPLLWRKKNVN